MQCQPLNNRRRLNYKRQPKAEGVAVENGESSQEVLEETLEQAAAASLLESYLDDSDDEDEDLDLGYESFEEQDESTNTRMIAHYRDQLE